MRGIYQPRDQTADPSNMMFHYDYVQERVRQEMPQRSGDVGWYIERISNPQCRDGFRTDRHLFTNSRAETKTETERAFQQSFLSSASAVITAMNIMSFVIIGIILLVLGNTMIMSARERTHEYAVLKALGFSGGKLVLPDRRRIADSLVLRERARVAGDVSCRTRLSAAPAQRLVPDFLHQAGNDHHRVRRRR